MKFSWFNGKRILFMNNLDKEKNNLCEISKYLHINILF